MSNECYKASAFLRKFFHNDDIAMTVIAVAEAEENYTTLRIGLIHLRDKIETLMIELGEAEKRKKENRMGLEAENTEYNLGHDVKYYTEE